MWIIILIIVVIIWKSLEINSENELVKIKNKFYEHSIYKQKEDVDSYKRHVSFLKFSKFMLGKFPWILAAIVLIIATGMAGFIFVLFALWFKSSLKDTNYKGYNKYKKASNQHTQELDEWVVIANQTILKK